MSLLEVVRKQAQDIPHPNLSFPGKEESDYVTVHDKEMETTFILFRFYVQISPQQLTDVQFSSCIEQDDK